jgi:hypothetical protein
MVEHCCCHEETMLADRCDDGFTARAAARLKLCATSILHSSESER